MPTDAASLLAEDPSPLSNASISLLTFLACKSDPPASALLSDLSWQLQPSSLPLPCLHFLLQCATVDQLITEGLQGVPTMAAALTPPPSLSSSSPPAGAAAVSPVVRAVSVLCSHIESMAVCHPTYAELRVVNSRLRLLLRLHTALLYLQAQDSQPDGWKAALLRGLFPSPGSVRGRR